ncbi:hypothetical protein BH23VER1_BH23VER1_32380 [soil metagenome]
MKKPAVLIFIGFIVLLSVMVVGVAVVVSTAEPKLFSSPTASRDVASIRGEWVGVLTPDDRESVEGEAPAEEMAAPHRWMGEDDSFLFEWPAAPGATKVELPDRWRAGLEERESYELVGFAAWYPRSDDEIDPGSGWRAPLTFRDPATLEALDDGALDRMGVPAGHRGVVPPQGYQTPKLRLLFRTSGVAHPRILSVDGGDAGTSFQVTYPLKGIDDSGDFTGTAGEWTYYDTALLAWHSVPMDLIVQVLTGDPVYADLPREAGSQVVLDDRVRAQWLGETAWEIYINSSIRQFVPASAAVAEADREALAGRMDDAVWGAWVEPVDPGVENPRMLVRASNGWLFSRHCGHVLDDGSVAWSWERKGGSNIDLMAAPDPSPGSAEPVRLVMVPGVTELRYSLAGLPDAPTPGQPEDLFDVVLSRITLSDDVDTAEQQVVGFVSTATQMAWDYNELWDEAGGLPADLPADRTFRDTSPRKLLLWYLEQTSGATARLDQRALKLEVNEEPWNFEEWWEEHAPDFFDW